jgi:hypothetical protein
MFKKILFANFGAIAPATSCKVTGAAGQAGEFPAETKHV